MSVLDGDDIVYVARSSVHRVMSVDLSVGSRLPAYSTSMGRVLLTGLPDPKLRLFFDRVRSQAYTAKTATNKLKLKEIILRARQQGYAMVDEELEPSLKSMAVPISVVMGGRLPRSTSGLRRSGSGAARWIDS